MTRSVVEILRTQGRGVTGALLVAGLATMYTLETWWLGRRLSLDHLLVYAVVGLGTVFFVARRVGFREDPSQSSSLSRAVVDFSELVVQSLVAATLVLTVFGVVDLNDEPLTVVRLILVQVVPLSFGASLASLLLTQTEQEIEEEPFPHNLGVFALGAVFVTFPLAPTEEMPLIATEAGWGRLAALIVLSVAVVHLVLHELEFRGQRDRIENRSLPFQIGAAFVVYAVGCVVSVALLAGFGQLSGVSLPTVIQLVVVHSFPASVGASGAEVVL